MVVMCYRRLVPCGGGTPSEQHLCLVQIEQYICLCAQTATVQVTPGAAEADRMLQRGGISMENTYICILHQ